jgi:hypothetical protein
MQSNMLKLLLVVAFVTLFTNAIADSCGPKTKQPGRLTVLVSGYTEGYLKNCGCSAGQFGGAGRMARMMYEEHKIAQQPQATDSGRGHAVVLVDTGNIINTGDSVKEIESSAILKIMESLPYQSVGLGFKELSCSQAELLKLLKPSKLPFTAANLKFTTPKEGEDHSAELNAMFQPYRVFEAQSAFRVGIIHVIDQTYVRSLNLEHGIEVTEAATAVEDILASHKAEADFWIVTVADGVQGSSRAKELGSIEGLGMIVGFERYTPPAELVGKLPLYVEAPFHKSRDVVRATVKFAANNSLASTKVDKLQLQEELKPTEEAQAIVDSTQPLLEAEANRLAEEKVGYSGPHPWYIGQTQCAMCHSDIVLMLQETAHIHAYETLFEKDQHRSAACLPCHVVGYDTPDRGGFNVFEKAPETQGVKCESCHGPGEYHALMMSGQPAPPDATEGGRNASGLLPVEPDASACIKCHDQLNSVGFSFEKYWPRVRHGNGQSPDLTDTSELGGGAMHMEDPAAAAK